MNTIKKIMFMSSNDKNSGMGILKLENKNNNIFGSLKTYQSKISGNYILGLKLEDKVIKQNVNIQNSCYNFVSNEIRNLDDVMGCVLIEITDGEFRPVIWGNEKDKNYKANIVNSLRQSINNISKAKSNSITQNKDTSSQTKHQQYTSNQTTPSSNNLNNYNLSQNTQLDKEYLVQTYSENTYSVNKNDDNQNTICEQCYNENLNSTKSLEEDATQLSFNTNQEDNLNNEKLQYNNNLQYEYSNYIPTSSQVSFQRISKLTSQNKLNTDNSVYHPIKYNNSNMRIDNLSQIALEEEIINTQNIPEIAISCNPATLFESSDEEINSTIDNELKNHTNSTTHDFYNMIAGQLQELFDRYPPENNLNKLVDNSYWVKIDTDVVNKHYVVGIIKNNDDIKYICYGVPGNYNQEPPIEMREYSQWLPADISDPFNIGYWVMYQDADTGENIYIN